MRWYVKVNGEMSGPVDDHVVAGWAREGRLGPETRIAVEGADHWTSIGQSPFAGYLYPPGQFQAPQPPQFQPRPKSQPTVTGVQLIVMSGALVLWLMSATGWFGVLLGLGVVGWTVYRHRQGKRSVVGLAFQKSGALTTAAVTVGVGLLFSTCGASTVFRAHQEAVKKEEAAALFKAEWDRQAQQRKALLQEVPVKIAAWRIRLGDALKATDPAEGSQLTATIQDELAAYSKTLGDPTPPELVTLSLDAGHQAENLKGRADLADSVKQTDLHIASGKKLAQEQNWLDADDAYHRALIQIEQVMGVTESLKQYVPQDFDAKKKLAEANRLRQSIAGNVTLAKQRNEREEQKRQQDADNNDPAKVKESCLALSTRFGTSSKLSDLQKDAMWPAYRGKKFAWDLRITEVSSRMLGGYTVQAKCAPESPSLIQDIQISYGADARSLVMQLSKDSVYKLNGTLTSTSTLFGLAADGAP